LAVTKEWDDDERSSLAGNNHINTVYDNKDYERYYPRISLFGDLYNKKEVIDYCYSEESDFELYDSETEEYTEKSSDGDDEDDDADNEIDHVEDRAIDPI